MAIRSLNDYNNGAMAKKTAALLPSTADRLRQFGDRLRMARLRRGLSARRVAERAGMAPMTLRSLERGGSGVTMGAYLSVMQVLGIETDLDLLGKADPLGRELQDARLPRQVRASRPALPRSGIPAAAVEGSALKDEVQDDDTEGGYITADALAALIDPQPSMKKQGR